MKSSSLLAMASLLSIQLPGLAAAPSGMTVVASGDPKIGRVDIETVPFDPARRVSSATYTPSGKVLVTYAEAGDTDPRSVRLATMDDDGRNVHPFFAQMLPKVEKANGIRYMVFSDNRRVFLGDFVVECPTSLETCKEGTLLPVEYPAEVSSGGSIFKRWSEMIVAPDNRHVAWTTLLANYSAVVSVGELERTATGYRIAHAQIVSTLNPFKPDPAHSDGSLPVPVLGGEVKQFVHGGAAISMVGAVRRDTPDSVVQQLSTGRKTAVTDTPGYTETTIFSPDERLGVTMTTRFSPRTDLAVLGLMPRPYPDSLNMGVSMLAYTYSVSGVRGERVGNIGPALIGIASSETKPGYMGVDLATDQDWVFRSPMSWHPGSARAMWIEGQRGTHATRIRVVRLPDYRAGVAVAAVPTPDRIAFATPDLSAVAAYAKGGQATDVKVYGHSGGYIHYRRTPQGSIDKEYFDFSDDGANRYSGSERVQVNPMGRTTYVANVTLAGPTPGRMDLQLTFGPIMGKSPAQIVFDKDATGAPLSRGTVDYAGTHLSVNELLP